MSEKEKTLHRILTSAQTGSIVARIAETLQIPIYEAFRRFFISDTYKHFREYRSIESALSDPAIVDLFLQEQ